MQVVLLKQASCTCSLLSAVASVFLLVKKEKEKMQGRSQGFIRDVVLR